MAIKKQWYGCPRCASAKYERRDSVEGESLIIWCHCRDCGHYFGSPLLWWIED